MRTTILFLALAAYLRLWGAAMRLERPRFFQAVGWVACGLAVWLATFAVSAWSPLWTALIPVAIGFAVSLYFPNRVLFLAGDLAVVLMTARASRPPLEWSAIGLLVLAIAAIAFLADTVVARHGSRWRSRSAWYAAVLIFMGAAPLAASPDLSRIEWYARQSPIRFCRAGFARIVGTERVALPTGAVAWIDYPSNGRREKGAIFFHGAHPAGAWQPAAIAIRRALLDSGYVVLSLDQRGYGQSPLPADDSLAAWDPLPSERAALAVLRERVRAGPLIAVGHSAGCDEVIRVLIDGAPVQGAVIMGAAFEPPVRTDYWYQRFLRDRHITRSIPPALYTQIYERYFRRQALLDALPTVHPLIRFVRFEFDNPDLVKTRDRYFAAIKGPKVAYDVLGSTHYLNTAPLSRCILADVSVAARLEPAFALPTVSSPLPVSPVPGVPVVPAPASRPKSETLMVSEATH